MLLKDRISNIELLRIISMFLVLLSHASYSALNPPTLGDIDSSIGGAFLRGLCESLSEVCVNAFILISGWFGIRFSCIRFLQFIFQVLFISFSVYYIMRFLGFNHTMTAREFVNVLLFKHRGYWFVRAYIILYLFAPILNSFANQASKNQLEFFLFSFFSCQFVFGFYNTGSWFAGGYSPLSFMGLYLLANYLHFYPSRYALFDKRWDFFIYFFISVITA